MPEVPDDFAWPPPWKLLPLPSGYLGLVGSVEAELQSEVCPGHPLYRVACRAIAWNAGDTNEFLLSTANPAMLVAFVHLTWKHESDPHWPYTLGYPDWGAFREAWAAEDAST